jgi:excisionase family DNA binding protein
MSRRQPSLTAGLLTRKEVAARLHVHADTVKHWVYQGVLKAYRLPGTRRLLFRAADVDALLEEVEPAIAATNSKGD